jgi:hypothetical protein
MGIFTHRYSYRAFLTLVSVLVIMGGQLSRDSFTNPFYLKSNTPATPINSTVILLSSRTFQNNSININAEGTFNKSEPVGSLVFTIANPLEF